MKVTVVSSSELGKSEDNPTMCWSPKRYLSGCLGCPTLLGAIHESQNLDGALSRLKCKPKLTPDGIEKIEQYMNLTKRVRELRAEIKSIEGEW